MDERYVFVEAFKQKIEHIPVKERMDLFLKMAEEAGIEEDERTSMWMMISLVGSGLDQEVATVLQSEFETFGALREFLARANERQ